MVQNYVTVTASRCGDCDYIGINISNIHMEVGELFDYGNYLDDGYDYKNKHNPATVQAH